MEKLRNVEKKTKNIFSLACKLLLNPSHAHMKENKMVTISAWVLIKMFSWKFNRVWLRCCLQQVLIWARKNQITCYSNLFDFFLVRKLVIRNDKKHHPDYLYFLESPAATTNWNLIRGVCISLFQRTGRENKKANYKEVFI